MTWYTRSWQHMHQVHQQAQAGGKDVVGIAQIIDESYPYTERSGWAYKAWRDARRDFFRQHLLPLRRAKKPKVDLLSSQLDLKD